MDIQTTLTVEPPRHDIIAVGYICFESEHDFIEHEEAIFAVTVDEESYYDERDECVTEYTAKIEAMRIGGIWVHRNALDAMSSVGAAEDILSERYTEAGETSDDIQLTTRIAA
jgi:hypothetical protein